MTTVRHGNEHDPSYLGSTNNSEIFGDQTHSGSLSTDRGSLSPNQLQLLPRRLQPCKVIAGMVR
ncbi:MAG: hypothetical protein ACK4ZJ_10855, partial [Allorhizobium sp.]